LKRMGLSLRFVTEKKAARSGKERETTTKEGGRRGEWRPKEMERRKGEGKSLLWKVTKLQGGRRG